jgi:hypothetical protein
MLLSSDSHGMCVLRMSTSKKKLRHPFATGGVEWIYSDCRYTDTIGFSIYFISNGLSGAMTESVRVLFPVVTLVTL